MFMVEKFRVADPAPVAEAVKWLIKTGNERAVVVMHLSHLVCQTDHFCPIRGGPISVNQLVHFKYGDGFKIIRLGF